MLGVQTCALPMRSEEHTSELQSHDNLVCRLLLEQNRGGRVGAVARTGAHHQGPPPREHRPTAPSSPRPPARCATSSCPGSATSRPVFFKTSATPAVSVSSPTTTPSC